MTYKPPLLFYCQHSLGMGHLVRALTLAESLVEHFQVIFLNGGRFPAHTVPPAGVDVINLPPIGMTENNQLYSQDPNLTTQEALAIRKEQILAVFAATRPSALLIELFPFGRKKFAGELIPLLKAARRQMPKRAAVFCSLRDIMVNARRDQLRHDNRARWLVERYFDGVLVHSDPRFATLEESFKPSRALDKPVFYTGFVAPRGARAEASERQRQLLVSVGGGMVGAPLLQLAIQAQPLLWAKLRLPMTIVAGPFLPETDWQAFQREAGSLPGLTLLRQVPNLENLLASHAVSISQGGYNTVMDILKSGISALVVPYSQGQENEQSNRAERLGSLGLLRTVELAELNAQRLVDEVEALLNVKPATVALDMDGAAQSARIIRDNLAGAAALLAQENHRQTAACHV